MKLFRPLPMSRRQASWPPPRLRIWNQEDENEDADCPHGSTLKLGHPLLRVLEYFSGSLELFDQIHAQLVLYGLFQHPLAAGRAIKNLTRFPACLDRAVFLFSHLDSPDAFIANTILRSFLSFDDPEAAFRFYCRQFLAKNVRPNHFTFPLLAKMCTELDLGQLGEKTHALSLKLGLQAQVFVQNSLIHMYFSVGKSESAGKLFHERIEEDLVTWNSMVDGYAKKGMLVAARKLFDEMPERDLISWNALIAGYMGIGDIDSAEELFVAMPERDIVSWNSMIDGYAKAGKVEVTREVFDRMPARNLVSWNTILALYTRMKNYNECLKLFNGMLDSGEARPNEATLVSVLTACANIGDLETGKRVHTYLKYNEKIGLDVLLLTALLNMYAKCGDMGSAAEIFNQMPVKSVVSWNSMITGYAMHGEAEKALDIFYEMEKRGPRPNDITFICVLSACTHGGMILEGWWYFDVMRRVYNIEPKAEHYGCMVDLLSRAGLLNEAKNVIEEMPLEPAPSIWGALLSACKTHSNCELGEIVCKRLIEMKPGETGPYVLLSNIYASEGRWDDVDKVRTLMKTNGLQKTTGFSLIDPGESEAKPPNICRRKRMLYSILSEMGLRMKSSSLNLASQSMSM